MKMEKQRRKKGVNESMSSSYRLFSIGFKLLAVILLSFLFLGLLSTSLLANTTSLSRDIGIVPAPDLTNATMNETQNHSGQDNDTLGYRYFDYYDADLKKYDPDTYYELQGRTGVIKPEEENETLKAPLTGKLYEEIDEDTNLTNYYVLLGDDDSEDENQDVEVSFFSPHNYILDFGSPVVLSQTMTITNPGNLTLRFSINLWDYEEDVPSSFLFDAQQIFVFEDEELLSEQPIFLVTVEPFQTRELTIRYEFLPLQKEVFCEEQTLKDILPEDARFENTSLPLSTVVDKKCYIKITHSSTVHYYDFELSLLPFDTKNVQSISIEQTGEELLFDNDIVVFRGTE